MLEEQHAVAEQQAVAYKGLTIRSKHVGRVQVITLRGRLELASCAVAEADLGAVLGDAEQPVVVDLREVELIDSAGIALLVTAFPRDRVRTLRFIPSRAPDVAPILERHGIDGAAMLTDPRPALRLRA
jgi:anti-anti-sigma factor